MFNHSCGRTHPFGVIWHPLPVSWLAGVGSTPPCATAVEGGREGRGGKGRRGGREGGKELAPILERVWLVRLGREKEGG